MSANFAAAYSGTIGKENAGRQFNTRLKMNIHDFISEYNNNERLMKDLFRRKRDAKNSKTGNERYIKDVKEKLRTLRNRQAVIERVLYGKYDLIPIYSKKLIRPTAV